jgi:threonine efflux protein
MDRTTAEDIEPFNMHNLSLILSVGILWALAVISPGPNFLMTVRLSITRSRRDGILAVAGIGVGTVIWGGAACFGIQALFVVAPWMYWTLKLSGASYLIVMGIKLIWSSRRGTRREPIQNGHAKSRTSAFWLGVATTVTNPRSAISVASIFATTMPAHPSGALGLLVIATMVFVSVVWYSIVAYLFALRRLAAAYQRGRRWIDRLAGACFILFGARLAAEG